MPATRGGTSVRLPSRLTGAAARSVVQFARNGRCGETARLGIAGIPLVRAPRTEQFSPAAVFEIVRSQYFLRHRFLWFVDCFETVEILGHSDVE